MLEYCLFPCLNNMDGQESIFAVDELNEPLKPHGTVSSLFYVLNVENRKRSIAKRESGV